MEVLRRCPLAIAQRLVHCAIAVSTAVLDRVTKTMSVAPLLTNNLDNSKQKTSNLLSPAPPPYSWSLLGKSEGPAPPPSSKISWSRLEPSRPRQNDVIFIGIPRLLGLIPEHAQRSIGYPRLSLTVQRSLYYGLIYMLCQQSHNQSSAIQPITCHQDTQTTCGDITQFVLFHYFLTSLMSLHRRIWKRDVLNWKRALSMFFFF